MTSSGGVFLFSKNIKILQTIKFLFQILMKIPSLSSEGNKSQIFLKGGSLAAARGVQRESR